MRWSIYLPDHLIIHRVHLSDPSIYLSQTSLLWWTMSRVCLVHESLSQRPCPSFVCQSAVSHASIYIVSWYSLCDSPYSIIFHCHVSSVPRSTGYGPCPLAHYRRFFTPTSVVFTIKSLSYLISVRLCGSHTVSLSDIVFSLLVSMHVFHSRG